MSLRRTVFVLSGVPVSILEQWQAALQEHHCIGRCVDVETACNALENSAAVSFLIDLITPIDREQVLRFLAQLNSVAINQPHLWPTVILTPNKDFYILAHFEPLGRIWVHADSEPEEDFAACIEHLADNKPISHLNMADHNRFALELSQ